MTISGPQLVDTGPKTRVKSPTTDVVVVIVSNTVEILVALTVTGKGVVGEVVMMDVT